MGKTYIYVVRNLSIVKCKVCIKIECKFKLLVPKWDSFAELVKKGKWIKGKGNDLTCAHAKNKTIYVSMDCPYFL